LGPSIRMCNLIFILCAAGFLVFPEEQVYYITLDKTGLLISKSFLPTFTNSCPTIMMFALLLSSLLVGAKREIFWPSICSQNHASIYFLCPLQNRSSTPMSLLPFHFAPHSSNIVNAEYLQTATSCIFLSDFLLRTLQMGYQLGINLCSASGQMLHTSLLLQRMDALC